MAMFTNSFVEVLVLLLFLLCITNSIAIDSGSTTVRYAKLDFEGRHIMKWEVDHESKFVEFEITAETKGYVGFGISPQGMMLGADIVVGGIADNGQPYFENRHGVGNEMPELDAGEESWKLLEASENSTHTMLKFIREFDSCKDGDLPFTSGTTKFIWAMGKSDTLEYHDVEKGVLAVNMLDPEILQEDYSHLKSYQVKHRMVMPKVHTSYWCTIHKSPVFTKKHHVVAFDTKLTTPEAVRHAHHYGIYKCSPPPGVDVAEFFEPFVGQKGGDCYVYNQTIVPSDYCRSLFYVWAVGGKAQTLPDHVGYPIGLDGENQTEYYMYEIHYDNPSELDNVEFETATVVYYTEQLRDVEAGIWVVGKFLENMVAITIPPKSTDLVLASHCSSTCLQDRFPKDGIHVINVLLHAHLAGRKIRMRHFRNNKELPWGANDESYDFNYQQSRPLREYLHILPGDHLTTECTYDSNFRNGTTVGGQSTREEMCESIMWYYPKMDLLSCYSEYPIANWFNKFGIEEAEWNNDYNQEPRILKPEKYVNMSYTQVLDTMIDWTQELREEITWDARYAEHIGSCVYETGLKVNVPVTYPHVKQEYVEERSCSPRNSDDSSPAPQVIAHMSTMLMFVFTLVFFPFHQ